jgi:hypothetical protein
MNVLEGDTMRVGIRCERELHATRGKLRDLEGYYEDAAKRECTSHGDDVTLWSLMRLIKQLKEEIIRCESRLGLSTATGGLAGATAKVIPSIERKGIAMIPEFDENGNLPAGIHRATLDEIAERFGRRPEVRRAQMQSLRWLVDLVGSIGAERLVVNGSFVTDVFEPNDVDCVLLMRRGFKRDRRAVAEVESGLPFIHAQLVRGRRFDDLVKHIFAMDRRGNAKGVIEVIL